MRWPRSNPSTSPDPSWWSPSATSCSGVATRAPPLNCSERFGLPPDAPATVVADVVASRTGTDRDRLVGTVSDTPITSEAELVELARSVDDLRKEILHGT
jgi:hypothetical protein